MDVRTIQYVHTVSKQSWPWVGTGPAGNALHPACDCDGRETLAANTTARTALAVRLEDH